MPMNIIQNPNHALATLHTFNHTPYGTKLLLQRFMPPILQRPITPTPSIPLRIPLLRQMPLAVRDYLAHML
jgi:hypothetical protein